MKTIIQTLLAPWILAVAVCCMVLGCENFVGSEIRFGYTVTGITEDDLKSSSLLSTVYNRLKKIEVKIGEASFSAVNDEARLGVKGYSDYISVSSSLIDGDYDYEFAITFEGEGADAEDITQEISGSLTGSVKSNQLDFTNIQYQGDHDQDGNVDGMDIQIDIKDAGLLVEGGKFTLDFELVVEKSEDAGTLNIGNDSYDAELVIKEAKVTFTKDADSE